MSALLLFGGPGHGRLVENLDSSIVEFATFEETSEIMVAVHRVKYEPLPSPFPRHWRAIEGTQHVRSAWVGGEREFYQLEKVITNQLRQAMPAPVDDASLVSDRTWRGDLRNASIEVSLHGLAYPAPPSEQP